MFHACHMAMSYDLTTVCEVQLQACCEAFILYLFKNGRDRNVHECLGASVKFCESMKTYE